jgi:HSP20 family molecular chaperone IbpA
MHNSDLNPTTIPRRYTRLIIGAGVLSILALLALSLYAWQLNRQVASLTPQTTGAAAQALMDSSQQSGNPLAAGPTALAPDPFQQMEAIRQQMDAMMNSVFGGPLPAVTGLPGLSSMSGSSLFGADPFAGLGMHQPQITLRETNRSLEVVIAVPEGQAFELGTEVEEDRLTVSGTITWQASQSSNGFAESRSGSSQFSRTIMLPDTVVPTGMVTEHHDTEIVIRLPKA